MSYLSNIICKQACKMWLSK